MNTRLSTRIAGLTIGALELAGLAAHADGPRPGLTHTNAGTQATGTGAQPAPLNRARAVTMTPPELAKIRTAAIHAVSGASTDHRSTSSGPNWSGQEMDTTAPGTFQGVSGSWTVPAVQATTTNKYSSTWVGVDGFNNRQLIQTGTEEDSINGRTSYAAWWEILPATETLIRYTNGALAPVAPGDSMWAYIVKTATPNLWTIYLQNITRGWSFTTNQYFFGNGLTAEWVEEATQMGGVISPMPVFTPVTFTNLEYASAGKWWYTALTNATNGMNLVQNGHIYAYPDAPIGANPQRFTIYAN